MKQRSESGDAPDLLPARIQRFAADQSDRSILSFLDEDLVVQQSWTFAELDLRARSIAGHLQSLGQAGQPVVIAFPSCLDFAAAFIGCLYAGAIAVPTSLPRAHGVDERMSLVVADSGARCVLTVERQRAVLEKHLTSWGRDVEVIATDGLPDSSAEWSPPSWSDSQLALLQYTSGSTRAPRGVMVSHGNLRANLESLHEVLRTHQDSVGVSWLPLFHDMGLVGGLLEPLWVGYPAFLMAPATFLQSPLRWPRAVTLYGGTVGGGPNFAYQACIEAAMAAGVSELDLSTWDVAGNGAEPVRADTLRQFRAVFGGAGLRPEALTPSYGLAEATLMVTANNGTVPPYEMVVDDHELGNGQVAQSDPQSSSAKPLVSSGRPGTGTIVRIVRPDDLTEAPADAVGEVWVKSMSVAQGYWNKPEDTLAVFGARLRDGEGPFLRTGDLGFLHEGELFVTGRLKDMIVIRGVNFYPHDIEHTVEASHPALRQDAGAVVGIEEANGVGLVAVQEVRRDFRRTIDPDEVFDAIRRAVARQHQLALDAIILLKPFGLPRTTSGKVQRSECKAAVIEGTLPALYQWQAPAIKPVPIDFTGEPLEQPGVLERQLVEWLKRELALPDLGWQTPLMELGVDSLKGVELGTALSAAFDHTFSATLLIDYPTIEALARLIRTDVLGVGKDPAPSISPAPPMASNNITAEQIMALDEGEVDALLRRSIDEVLGVTARDER